MKHQKLLLLLLIIAGSVQAQYRFRHLDFNDHYDAAYDSAGISCLYRFSAKKAEPTQFHKVFLDEDLSARDSVIMSVPGRAILLDSYVAEFATTYIFYCKEKHKADYLQFMVQWKSGAIRNKFNLAGDQLVSGINKANRVGVSIIESNVAADRIILTFRYTRGGIVSGEITAFRLSDGRRLWTMADNLRDLITTEREVVGIRYASYGDATLVILNKETGAMVHSANLSTGAGPRDISVLTSNGSEIMVAGNERPTKRSKSGMFYMTLFDLSGNVVMDQVDTAALLSSQRMHTLGHVFDDNGNLVIVGEGWKLDYTRAVATTALSIALIAMGGTRVYVAGPDHKITSLFMASISTETGRIKDFHNYPVGPWMNFSRMITDGQHIMIRNFRHLLELDPQNLNAPPRDFAGMENMINIFMTRSGAVMVLAYPKALMLKKL